MINFEKIVLECYQEMIKERGLDIKADINNRIGKESGLDSLGFVNLIMSIEEKLDKTLDPVLIQLRKCKNIKEMILLIEDTLTKA